MGKRLRSPAYPAFDLEEAVSKAAALYEREYTSPASVEVASGAWGYSPHSSSGPQAIATLKQYGLIEEEGRGPDRHVQVSQLALDILEPEEGTDRVEALQAAALSPQVFQEIADQFASGGSDANIKAFLVRRGFNSKAIPVIIRCYRGTEQFASLSERGKIGSVGPSQTPRSQAPLMLPPGTKSPSMDPQKPAETGFGVLQLPVVEHDGSMVYVSIPKMTEHGFAFFKRQLEVYQPGIVIPKEHIPSKASEPEEPGCSDPESESD